ncbi:hypothetical protein Q5P01_008112 [Channa striata]|uniref:Uncharacterized protein n=1 Tax=Channa striata TaxID=64152 RepID=A0AA88NDJ9_CHASR|nr:hypothetical protein Q5P01_008112 [Channa striata]
MDDNILSSPPNSLLLFLTLSTGSSLQQSGAGLRLSRPTFRRRLLRASHVYRNWGVTVRQPDCNLRR